MVFCIVRMIGLSLITYMHSLTHTHTHIHPPTHTHPHPHPHSPPGCTPPALTPLLHDNVANAASGTPPPRHGAVHDSLLPNHVPVPPHGKHHRALLRRRDSAVHSGGSGGGHRLYRGGVRRQFPWQRTKQSRSCVTISHTEFPIVKASARASFLKHQFHQK